MDLPGFNPAPPPDLALPPCKGCGDRHRPRVSAALDHLCPCCMHPLSDHLPPGQRPRSRNQFSPKPGRCSHFRCECMYPDAPPRTQPHSFNIQRQVRSNHTGHIFVSNSFEGRRTT